MAIVAGIWLILILMFIVFILAAPTYKKIGAYIERKLRPFSNTKRERRK